MFLMGFISPGLCIPISYLQRPFKYAVDLIFQTLFFFWNISKTFQKYNISSQVLAELKKSRQDELFQEISEQNSDYSKFGNFQGISGSCAVNGAFGPHIEAITSRERQSAPIFFFRIFWHWSFPNLREFDISVWHLWFEDRRENGLSNWDRSMKFLY